MKTLISIRFLCGHFETLSAQQVKKDQITISPTFKINNQIKAESGQYCLACSNKPKIYPSLYPEIEKRARELSGVVESKINNPHPEK